VAPLRQRVVTAALEYRSSLRTFARRESAALQRRGPVHRFLHDLYQYTRRHPVSVNQWDAEYAGDYAERLDRIHHIPHHAVIYGYLTYLGKGPRVLDIGCGHGRLLQVLAGLPFSDYLGFDWSAQGVEHARSLSVAHTRFEVADMNKWTTTERFDAIVMNNSLTYSDDPREMFERALGWLADGGLIVVAMHRSLGVRYLWSRIDLPAVDHVAGCAVRDELTGAVWDVKAFRPA
jgi:SAM-dependent methyltransferase